MGIPSLSSRTSSTSFLWIVVVSVLQSAMGCSLSPTARALDEGDALYDEGNVRGAMQRYSRVLESDPDNARAAYSMGVAHYTLDEHSRALPYFDRAVALDEQRAAYRMQRGHTLVQLRAFDRAIEDYQTVIALDPGLAKAYYSVGIAYYNSHDYGNAVRWLKRYLELSPRADDRERVEGLIRSLREWDS
jgi:superkiller protein 3